MDALVRIQAEDDLLLARVATTMADAVNRCGAWIACKPGCTGCCLGPFAISAMDAARLRRGMAQLQTADPVRAEAVRARAKAYLQHMGDIVDVDSLPEEMDEVPCPALDLSTGLCDLYESRPLTCRTFGPATRIGNGPVGACELCFQGASDDEIERCAVDIGFTDEDASAESTIVARALVD